MIERGKTNTKIIKIELDLKKIWDNVKKPFYCLLGASCLAGAFYLGRATMPEKYYAVEITRENYGKPTSDGSVPITEVTIHEKIGRNSDFVEINAPYTNVYGKSYGVPSAVARGLLFSVSPNTTEQDLKNREEILRNHEKDIKGKSQKHNIEIIVRDGWSEGWYNRWYNSKSFGTTSNRNH